MVKLYELSNPIDFCDNCGEVYVSYLTHLYSRITFARHPGQGCQVCIRSVTGRAARFTHRFAPPFLSLRANACQRIRGKNENKQKNLVRQCKKNFFFQTLHLCKSDLWIRNFLDNRLLCACVVRNFSVATGFSVLEWMDFFLWLYERRFEGWFCVFCLYAESSDYFYWLAFELNKKNSFIIFRFEY